jgi:hypothetical protein
MYGLNKAVLRLLEDGSFLLATEGGEAKLRIRSVATGDDVLRAEATGARALAAKLFLPEAAEAAAKEGIKLVDIQDIADPLALVVKELLRARRPELLARLFQELLPDAAVRNVLLHGIRRRLRQGDPLLGQLQRRGRLHRRRGEVLRRRPRALLRHRLQDLRPGDVHLAEIHLRPPLETTQVVLELKTDLPK